MGEKSKTKTLSLKQLQAKRKRQTNNMIPIAIFDDHDLVVESVTKLMEEAGYQVVISSTKVSDFLEKLDEGKDLELLIVDVVADDTIGLDLFSTILSKHKVNIIAYTSLTSPALVANLFDLGVKGYVSKRQSARELLVAAKTVLAGYKHVPKEYQVLISHSKIQKKNTMTDRELEILRLIAKGKTTKEMAEELFVSVNTIESHRKNIFQKFEVKNVAELLLAGYENGYLTQ